MKNYIRCSKCAQRRSSSLRTVGAMDYENNIEIMTKKITRDGGAFAAAVAVIAAMLLIGVTSASALVATTLDPGASGADVTDLQTFLATDASVYPEGIISGFYGPLTTAAVQRFQCKYGIVCTGSVTTTGYGRVGPATLAKIQSLESQTPGVPNTGGTLDESAPIMTPETLTVSSTTAVIRWTTNEPALNSVLYASVWPFYLGTAPSATSGIGMNANVVLTGLVPNHTYRYVRQSVDMAGNVQYGFGGSFTTSSN